MSVKVTVNVKAIEDKLNRVIHDDETMKAVHTEFAKYCVPYTPMYTGTMSQSIEIDGEIKPEHKKKDPRTLGEAYQVFKDYVHYVQPYAHYQYTGEVYGPNIPFKDEDGFIYWRSPKDKKKYPTGRQLQYNKEGHEKASKEWDKAMMADKGEQFLQSVKNILSKKARELYG